MHLVLYRSAVDHVSDGKLGNLAVERSRDVRNMDDLGRHVPRAGTVSDLLLDETHPGPQDDEQTTRTSPSPSDSTISGIGPIDLGGADANAAD